MSNLNIDMDLLNKVGEIAYLAGEEVMKIYKTGDFGVEIKADNSPLTLADKASEAAIIRGLEDLTPKIPIVSEEKTLTENVEAAKGGTYWILDPLDGTKEFIKKNGEFTVIIGLIRDDRPVLGVILAPDMNNKLYLGAEEIGAFMSEDKGELSEISTTDSSAITAVAASRSHLDEKTEQLISGLESKPKLITAGSALKIGLVAEGKVDAYPRFHPLMEWDTAAGDAIVRAAGGRSVGLDGEDLKYSKPDFRHVGFVCYNNRVDIDMILSP